MIANTNTSTRLLTTTCEAIVSFESLLCEVRFANSVWADALSLSGI